MPLTTLIIVNYNVQHFLEQCLLSVQKAVANLVPLQGAGGAEIFVVDNNSVDNSVAMVREKFPEVELIVNKKNKGFAVANNQAIRESTGKYVLLLNPDTVVREDTFVKCLGFMEDHPEAGGLGVKMIDGSGKFLPESKRGFPSPFVAFAKTFGLSALFSKSEIFNRYHLGHLNQDETHEVDVLAGAFMLLRRSVLDRTGLLDEAFFMYGEDIDLSYRIVQAGYKNYYFAGTTIIHYKGESTKKGSLNYVRTFYNAMLIFARKHFTGRQARLFIAMIYGAIYLRASMTLLTNFFKKSALPLMDAVLMLGGLLFLKYFWARYYYHDPGYYDPKFVFFNMPFYTALWMGAVFFTGGYDEPFNLRRLVRGLLIGTLVLSAVYGFLPLELRPSRAILLLGAVWAIAGTVALRTAVHFFKMGNLSVGMSRPDNLVIAGSPEESERVRALLSQASVQKNFIGIVFPSPQPPAAGHYALSSLDRLDEVVQIYKIDEIIFCSRDVSSESIMQWMTRLGPGLSYKIVPKESISIIGSSSKDAAGELYTIDIRFKIATPMARRNKRVLDLLFVACGLLLVPVFLIFVKNRGGFLRNIFQVIIGKKSWVSYASHRSPAIGQHLPKIRKGVLSPLDALGRRHLDDATIQRLNFLYAKDYDVWRDLEVVWKGWRELGRQAAID
jgi:GT2 family glycosyltransferase